MSSFDQKAAMDLVLNDPRVAQKNREEGIKELKKVVRKSMEKAIQGYSSSDDENSSQFSDSLEKKMSILQTIMENRIAVLEEENKKLKEQIKVLEDDVDDLEEETRELEKDDKTINKKLNRLRRQKRRQARERKKNKSKSKEKK